MSAASLSNTGTITIEGGNNAGNSNIPARLSINAAPAVWTGTANLIGDALIEFASGIAGNIVLGGTRTFEVGTRFPRPQTN